MGVLLQLRVGVGGEHLAVGVDVHTLALGLFQQKLQVPQVVAGDDDEGALFHGHGDGGGNGMAIGLGVGLVQQSHAGQVHLAHFHDDGQQIVHAIPVGAHSGQSLVEEAVDPFVLVTQNPGVVCVGGHAPDAEEDEGLQGANILVCLPEGVHVIVLGDAGRAGDKGGIEEALGLTDPVNEGFDVVVIKADVGDGGKQGLQHHLVDLLGQKAFPTLGGLGQTDESAGQFILELGVVCGLAAHALLACAAAATGGLLTLETKHSLVHHIGFLLG